MSEPQRAEFVGWPKNGPEYHNASTDPCDMMQGPCACGAWHTLSEWLDGSRLHQRVTPLSAPISSEDEIRLSDIQQAYFDGLLEAESIQRPIPDELKHRACDAYVKLFLERQRKRLAVPPSAPAECPACKERQIAYVTSSAPAALPRKE